LFRKIVQKLQSARRSFSVNWSPADDFWYSIPGTKTVAGADVSAWSAMQVSAVYACVRVRAETIASVPWHLYRRQAGGGRNKTVAVDHPLYSVIHDAPNPEQTAFEWREMMVGHLSLRGNAFSYIERDIYGWPVALWPIHPESIRPRRLDSGEVIYDATMQGGQSRTLRAWDVLHLRGLSDDGLNGLGPLQLAVQTIGASIAADEYAARFWANDGTPPGVLTTSNQIGKSAEESRQMKEAIRQKWKESMTGTNRHMIPVLDMDLKWQSVGVDPETAQALETRNFQVSDIARVFRVPPHKIGQLDKATFSNIEHQSIEFVTDTIRPEVVRIEQAMNRALLLDGDRLDFFIEANLEGLLRGDIKSRYEAYKIGLSYGWLSPDEIRSFETMNPQPDGMGAHYWMPTNMAPVRMILDGEVPTGGTPIDGRPAPPAGTEGDAMAARIKAAEMMASRLNGNGTVKHE
jgi:HK97 family phage portal protein